MTKSHSELLDWTHTGGKASRFFSFPAGHVYCFQTEQILDNLLPIVILLKHRNNASDQHLVQMKTLNGKERELRQRRGKKNSS